MASGGVVQVANFSNLIGRSAMSEIPCLSEADLIALGITTQEVVECIESAIHKEEAGRVWSAPKAVIIPPEDGRYMMAALAAMDDPSLLAVKIVVLNPENPQRGLPQINGLVTMLDSSSGLPVAILDGNWITAVRTAGLSAVAACRLANPDAQSVGFVGCGVQARSHLQSFADLFPLKSIKLFGRGRANKDRLAAAASDLGLSVEVSSRGQDAIEDVDLVVTSITATGGPEPFLDANGLKPGAFAAITDLGVPWIRDSFGALDRVVIDDVEQEAALPNKLCDPTFIDGDLSGLVLGRIDGRSARDERAAFLFRGHALGDLALAVLALQKFGEGKV